MTPVYYLDGHTRANNNDTYVLKNDDIFVLALIIRLCLVLLFLLCINYVSHDNRNMLDNIARTIRKLYINYIIVLSLSVMLYHIYIKNEREGERDEVIVIPCHLICSATIHINLCFIFYLYPPS